MPNNPLRHKAGFIKVERASAKTRRKDLVSSILVNNRVFATASQELGSPNGGPSPTYGGGTATGGGPIYGGGSGGIELPV